jgi:hypothetical protein
MIIELGNHAPHRAMDNHPCVTRIHVPDFDDGSTHPDAVYEGRHPHDPAPNGEPVGKLKTPGPRLGGYTHKVGGITVSDFKTHRQEAEDYRGGVTRLPDHEALLAITRAWPTQSMERPAWLRVVAEEMTDPKVTKDIEKFLTEFYGCQGGAPADLEDRYWTKWGPPGDGPRLPALQALFTNDGRTQQAVNYAGGQVGATGAATASSSTTLTNTGASWTTNQWAGYRVYATVSGSVMVWGNVISNTATVLTVDRWYAAATPGGSAGSTPSSTATYLIADGGVVSAWFVGLTTTNITPAATDHSMSGEYTTAGGGYVRKIAPYALTSGTSPMTYTLTPVYTGNGSDTYPSTFYAINACNSMVVSDSTLAMKFETSLSASATVSASGDQVNVTETVTGS